MIGFEIVRVPKESSRFHRTALHLACANGHPEVVTLLADSKCQLNLCDTENRTALVKAVQCQQEECAAILLEHGADPNVMDIDGNTALHYAVLGENIGIIAKLLSYKATVEAKNKDDLTPLSLAKSRNKEQMVELLLNRSAKMNSLIFVVCFYFKGVHQVMKTSRSSKEISHDEYKVKEKFNSMDDLSDLTQSTETVSEHGPSPYSNYENFMLLIKQLCKDCKDSDSLCKIQNAVLSYERSIKLGKNQCEVLTKKVKTMENRVSGLHKKLSETREIKSELEHQKVELEQELCNLRFTIKEEKEKRQRTDLLYEKIREQLIKKEEQYIKETEMNRELETTLRTLEMELQVVRNTLSQVVEERNETQRLLSQEQNARKLQDENLSHLLCTQKETETACKEINNDNLTAKLETVSSKCIRLDEKNKLLQQELLSMKAIEKKCEKLDNKNKKLKQEVVKLKRHMEMNMIEYSEVGQYKQKIEEQARQDVADKLKQVNSFLQTQRASKEVSERLIEYHNASIRSHLELRNKDLESELSKMQTSLDYNRRELERYESLYLEELEGRKSLESKLNETNERLAEVRTELLLQKQKDRSVINTLNMRPALEIPSVRDLNSFVPNRNSTPRENLKIPILSPHTSTYVIKMRQEFEETLTRELKEDAAKFESEFYRACPVELIDQSNSRQDLLLKTSQEYTEILKRNYMI
ncbi:PREDICTED: ankyrin repeat domain-containing protein 26-like [Miniopterus natalensis]|uniref:ankyrin repeat domain-containing protein 26-like n=1 Tax=Miniopterus natalensis TaxID=291302 RepID=UPI0007A71F12|nr:PREDICTED: ankyrin repeat domain-containing protein 26-like [Miniopterus natalensis]